MLVASGVSLSRPTLLTATDQVATSQYLLTLTMSGVAVGTEVVSVNVVASKVKDAAGNFVAPVASANTMTLVEKVRPTFTLVRVSNTEATVTFSEPVTGTGAAGAVVAADFTVAIEDSPGLALTSFTAAATSSTSVTCVLCMRVCACVCVRVARTAVTCARQLCGCGNRLTLVTSGIPEGVGEKLSVAVKSVVTDAAGNAVVSTAQAFEFPATMCVYSVGELRRVRRRLADDDTVVLLWFLVQLWH